MIFDPIRLENQYFDSYLSQTGFFFGINNEKMEKGEMIMKNSIYYEIRITAHF